MAVHFFKRRVVGQARSHRRASSPLHWSEVMLPQSIARGRPISSAFTPHWARLNWLVVAIMAVLAFQLFNLQIIGGDRWRGLADGNRLRQEITYAQRGRILDRNGVVLAQNVASFQLTVYPYLLPAEEHNRQQHYRDLEGLIEISENTIKSRAEARGLGYFQPVLIKANIGYSDALVLEKQITAYPAFRLDVVPVRQYRADSALAHVLGYVGRADEQDLLNNPQLGAVDFIGKSGVEKSYDHILRGRNGNQQTEVDARGVAVRVLNQIATQSGRDIKISLDYGLQQHLAAAMKEQMAKARVKRAAGVALDPISGGVLAMVSLPSYDNNLFARGISNKQYQQITADTLQPLHNKAIGGSFPSGSIIKPLHLAGALERGVVTEHTKIIDRGKITVPSVYDASVSYTFLGWNLSGLGVMDARRAIAMSSDIYFYTVGGGYQSFRGLGEERLGEIYRQFGLGELSGIDMGGETPGLVPTPQWKRKVKNEDWFIGDTYNISIGQGDLLATPLQMALATAAIANGGKLLEPHIFKSTLDGRDQKLLLVRRQDFIRPENLHVVRDGMRQVIGGTTSSATFAGVPVQVAGKSGTAETDPTNRRRAHAWYTAFAPYERPEIVFAVILEEGEGGSQFAAPAIARAMEWYFKSR